MLYINYTRPYKRKFDSSNRLLTVKQRKKHNYYCNRYLKNYKSHVTLTAVTLISKYSCLTDGMVQFYDNRINNGFNSNPLVIVCRKRQIKSVYIFDFRFKNNLN